MEVLTDAKSVIAELGGTEAVAHLTGRKYNAVWNWGSVGTFPASTYMALTLALKAKGRSAPISLWRMKEPVES